MGMDEPRPDYTGILQRGIAAAKAHNRTQARALLQQALDLNAESIAAWLWMSGVVDSAVEQEACLRRVLALDPDHQAAQRGIALLRERVLAQLLAQGKAAVQSGEDAEARRLLTEVVIRDESDLEAWLWLSRVAETTEDEEICLENVLSLDPGNAEAQEGLAALRTAHEVFEVNPWENIPEENDETRPASTLAGDILGDEYREKHTGAPIEAAAWDAEPAGEDDSEHIASTLAGDVLGEAYREKYTTVVEEPEPEAHSAAEAMWARYADPDLCPRCGAAAHHEDRRCPACGQALWIRVRERQGRSFLLWILIVLQAADTAFLAVLPFVVMAIIGLRAGIVQFTQLIPVYLGQPSDLSPQLVAAILATLPRAIFFLLWLPMLISGAITVALFVRWRPIYYIMLAGALLGLASSVAGLALAGFSPVALVSGGFAIAMSLVNFALTLKLESDFLTSRQRTQVRLDSGLKTGMDYLLRGRAYAGQGLWTLAAIHFRRAAGLSPNQPDGLLGIAQAAVRLNDKPLARWALETARALRPDDVRMQTTIDGVLRSIGEDAE